MVKILYFARLKETLGASAEELALPQGVENLQALRNALAARGGAWAHGLANPNIRAAVNQEMASADTPVRDGDEVAFFPPVTGG